MRAKGLIVALDRNYKDEDAVRIKQAIQMIKGVGDVEFVEAAHDDFIIKARLLDELWDAQRDTRDRIKNAQL